jgi:hypothetical protein
VQYNTQIINRTRLFRAGNRNDKSFKNIELKKNIKILFFVLWAGMGIVKQENT